MAEAKPVHGCTLFGGFLEDIPGTGAGIPEKTTWIPEYRTTAYAGMTALREDKDQGLPRAPQRCTIRALFNPPP